MKRGNTPATMGLILACTALGGCFAPVEDVDSTSVGNGSTSVPDSSSPPSTTSMESSGESSGSIDHTTTTGPDPSMESSESTYDTTDPWHGSSGSTDHTTTTNVTDASTNDFGDSSSSSDTMDDSPVVVSIDPPHGATGLYADQLITITFSEPMDEALMDQALEFSSPSALVLSWNEDSTVLTIDPTLDLAYATGSSPIAVDPLEYTIEVTTDATDVAGNPLEEGVSSTFFTLRNLTVGIPHDSAYTGTIVGSTGEIQTGAGDDPIVGDHSDNVPRRGFMGFSISGLPSGIVQFNSAQLRADQWLVSGNPIPSLGSAVTIHHISPEVLPGGAFGSAQLENLGVWSDEDSYSATNTKSTDVTNNVQYDYENGETHTQYRLELPTQTNFNTTTDRLRYNDEVLEINYLVP